MHNVEKWPKILKKVCGVYTARVLNYVRPFFNIMHERFRLYFTRQLHKMVRHTQTVRWQKPTNCDEELFEFV